MTTARSPATTSQVSIDGGAVDDDGSPARSWRAASILGADGRTYAFRVRATTPTATSRRGTRPGRWRPPASRPTSRSAASRPCSSMGCRMRVGPTTDASIMTTLARRRPRSRSSAARRAARATPGSRSPARCRQWGPVDPLQVGGWVAAYGNGVDERGAAPPGVRDPRRRGDHGPAAQRRRSARADAERRRRARTSSAPRLDEPRGLRQPRAAGVPRSTARSSASVNLGGTGRGGHGYDWNGRIGGALVPAPVPTSSSSSGEEAAPRLHRAVGQPGERGPDRAVRRHASAPHAPTGCSCSSRRPSRRTGRTR